jgi:hypothetical protein
LKGQKKAVLVTPRLVLVFVVVPILVGFSFIPPLATGKRRFLIATN